MYDIEMHQWHAYTVQLCIVYALNLVPLMIKYKNDWQVFLCHPSHPATACSCLAPLLLLCISFIWHYMKQTTVAKYVLTKPKDNTPYTYIHMYIKTALYSYIRIYTVGQHSHTHREHIDIYLLENQITESWIEAYPASQASHCTDYFTPCQYTQTCHCMNFGVCVKDKMVIG